jgi:hypothetical protein
MLVGDLVDPSRLPLVTTFGTKRECYMGLADTAVTVGQRLRVRLYVADSVSSPWITAAGHTATIDYAGATGDADGDSFIQLTQTVTEFSGATGNANISFLSGIGR